VAVSSRESLVAAIPALACPRNQLYPACHNQALMWFSGRAASRGIAWAESVARRRPTLLWQPWPAHDGRAAELARTKLADLADDPRVVDLLCKDVSAHAARRRRQLQAQIARRS